MILELAYEHYGDYMLENVLYDSKEVEESTGVFRTLWELTEPMCARKTHKMAIENMTEVCEEVESLIKQAWPSHAEKQHSSKDDRVNPDNDRQLEKAGG
jgi:hypothetical protein